MEPSDGNVMETQIQFKPVSADAILLEIIGHLGAAVSQSIPEDDQIIMGHVRQALAFAKTLRKAQAA